MAVTIDGTTGVSLVQDDVVTAADLAGDVSLGKVLQVVRATTTSQVANTTTTYADNGLSASITPSSTSSKILILVDQTSYTYRQTNDTHGYNVRLLRGSTTIYENERASMLNAGTSGNGYQELYSILNFSYLDSPATTSEVTYKNQSKAFASGSNGAITSQPGSRPSGMTLIEIAG